MTKCDECGKETSMPYKCKFCGNYYCSEHRLPENHNCSGLDRYQEKRKEEKKEEITYEPFIKGKDVKSSKDLNSSIDQGFKSIGNLLTRNLTYVILGLMLIGFILQNIIGYKTAVEIFGLLPLKTWGQPWRLITSMFLHGSLWHLFGNGMTLYFLGTYLEKIISKKYFLEIFFIGGTVGGIFYSSTALIGIGSAQIAAIGASGAIFAIGAALAILRPKLKVLIFPLFIPVPLYIAVFGVFLALSFLPGVAWQAHIGGMVVGALSGYWIKNEGKVKRTSQEVMRNLTRGL